MEKVTLSKLIAEAENIKKKSAARATKDLYVKSLDGTIVIQEPDRSLCLDAMDMGAEGDDYLVMESVIEPNLKDRDLLQTYGCATPLELIALLFKPGERSKIAIEAVGLAGYGDSVSAVEDLKN
jgi:hypothetical protein